MSAAGPLCDYDRPSMETLIMPPLRQINGHLQNLVRYSVFHGQ